MASKLYDLVDNETGKRVSLALSVEWDQTSFASIDVVDDESGENVASIILDTDEQVQAFLTAVDTLREDWKNRQDESG